MKKYKVYDGPILIARDMSLDVALCLIHGYVERYPNGLVGVRISLMDDNAPECQCDQKEEG